MRAYEDGKKAYEDGKPVMECPYCEEHELFADWVSGWNDAESEQE